MYMYIYVCIYIYTYRYMYPSDDIQLWRMMTKAVGRAHLEVFGQLLVFWIIDVICPDPF